MYEADIAASTTNFVTTASAAAIPVAVTNVWALLKAALGVDMTQTRMDVAVTLWVQDLKATTIASAAWLVIAIAIVTVIALMALARVLLETTAARTLVSAIVLRTIFLPRIAL